jgi:hypothetical protein
MCPAFPVPGMAAVTAGWATIHLRKNCPQLSMPSSLFAQSGSALPRTWRNSAPSANGRLISTATFLSRASGRSRFSASRSASD